MKPFRRAFFIWGWPLLALSGLFWLSLFCYSPIPISPLNALHALLAPFGSDDAGGNGDLATAWSDWEAFKREVADGDGPLAQITLAETALRALPAILTGERQATAALFPSGSLKLVEDVYKQNAVAERFNRVVAAAVRAFVAQRLTRTPSRPLRVLEIGAGTGATSEHVLRALVPHAAAIAEYRYTDVSRAFLIHAERQFGRDVSYLATGLFDVEKAPVDQGIDPASYDLVIAANVLHATADMRPHHGQCIGDPCPGRVVADQRGQPRDPVHPIDLRPARRLVALHRHRGPYRRHAVPDTGILEGRPGVGGISLGSPARRAMTWPSVSRSSRRRRARPPASRCPPSRRHRSVSSTSRRWRPSRRSKRGPMSRPAICCCVCWPKP